MRGDAQEPRGRNNGVSEKWAVPRKATSKQSILYRYGDIVSTAYLFQKYTGITLNTGISPSPTTQTALFQMNVSYCKSIQG